MDARSPEAAGVPRRPKAIGQAIPTRSEFKMTSCAHGVNREISCELSRLLLCKGGRGFVRSRFALRGESYFGPG